jgi:hypothetical protein
MRCANPGCVQEAIYFRSGSLHWIDVRGRNSEKPTPRRQMIWLCAECSRCYVVETWRPAGEQVRRLEDTPHASTIAIYIRENDVISIPASKSAEAFWR